MPSLISFVASALVVQATAIPCAPPGISDATVQLWAPNIVEVRGGLGNSKAGDSSGVGFVVGWRNGEAWIAVPAHVLYQGDRPPTDLEPLKRSLQIRFGPSDTVRQLCPARAGLSNPVFPSLTADTAFVCVEWNYLPLLWSTVTARSVTVNTDVELRGPEYTFKRPGKVLRIEKNGDDEFISASFTGELGMSGAPVASPAGLVGFYLGKGGEARAVAIATVRRLAGAAQVPWNLVDREFYDCRHSVMVCLTADTALVPQTLTATTNTDRKGIAIPLNGCRDLPESRYLLSDTTQQFVCEPMVALVHDDGTNPISVRVVCEPDLNGIWTSSDGLRMDCVAVGTPAMRQARCTGLQSVGVGMLTASITRDGDRLTVNGAFVDLSGVSHPTTGELIWKPGSLSGSLRVTGLRPVRIDLKEGSMMIVFWLLMAIHQAPPPLLQGDWQHVDVRSVEVNGDGACIRVWLEERRYSLQAIPDRRYQGAYQNMVHAVPVGAASFLPTCKFPALTSNPVATQTRMWAVVASPISDQRWRLRAQAGPGGGDFSLLPSDDFTTELAPSNGRLFDGAGPASDANQVLVFRTPSKPPGEARAELDATIAKLHEGGCLEVMSALATRKEAVAELCALRQQIAQMQGRLVSISMTAETEFDRVPATVSSPGDSGFKRQRGVFYEFTGTFDKARVPGNALVVEENGKWRVAALWF